MKPTLGRQLTAVLLATLLVGAAAGAGLSGVLHSAPVAIVIVLLVGALPLLWLANIVVRPLRQVLRSMQGVVASYRHGDFSSAPIANRDDEIGELLRAHNELGTVLREQRAHAAQRELLLDTVIQNSPVALVLVDEHQHVVYANLAARHMFDSGRTLLGHDFSTLLQRTPKLLALTATGYCDALVSEQIDGVEETYHLSQRSFRLAGRGHQLFQIKSLTRELSRQEVAAWKNLIRVLSHELNNSLAPIASMAHSGAELARRRGTADIGEVFAGIAERANHLHEFLSGYATLSKLPAPRPGPVDWAELIGDLARQQPLRVVGELPAQPGWLDRSQFEQALINVIKNAHEAQGPATQVEVTVQHRGSEQCIEVRDRGCGMTDTVLAQALLPFYSTKRSGTGLGLALTREIVEAHGGRIHLANREGGGLCVTLVFPLRSATVLRR